MFARLLPLALLAACASTRGPVDPPILTSDVDRFYAIYDAAGGHPAAATLQRDYLDAGSEGLHQFAVVRQLTGESIASAIEKDAAPFEKARQCVVVLPAIRERVRSALRMLAEIDPKAEFPPVTIAIGRARTAGTTSRAGVLIGLETLCFVDFLDPDVENRLVHVIAHEYAHIQQPASDDTDMAGATVLFASLVEGGAEFVAERITGSVGYTHLQRLTRGREREVESAFAAEVDKTDLSSWLYNGPGDAARPGDLGYWVGYRIVRSYYARASNKDLALQEILHVSRENAHDFLANSGWSPGMTLPADPPRAARR